MSADSTPRGLLIAIEGGDACGKRTQAGLLKHKLEQQRWLSGASTPGTGPMLVSFPRYGTPMGNAILSHLTNKSQLVENGRKSPDDAMVFQAMMTADKYDAAWQIECYRSAGAHVICDRWWPSSYVYGSSDGLDPQWLEDIHYSLPKADLTILLDVPAEIAISRRDARDRYEASLMKRIDVRDRYLAMAKSQRFGEWLVVDGTQDADKVGMEIWRNVSFRLKRTR